MFSRLTSTSDPAMLPVMLKYGDVTAFAALCAPAELFLGGVPDTRTQSWLADAYQAAGHADRLRESGDTVSTDALVDWLLR